MSVSTAPRPSDTGSTPRVDPEQRPSGGLGLNAAQVTGSAMAAVSAAVAASWLGVAGTIIGAVLGSLFGTVGSAVYAQTLRNSHDAVRRIAPPRETRPVPVSRTARRRLPSLPWRRVLAGAGLALVLALGVITAFEQLSGTSVSRLTGGDTGDGTTIGRVLGTSATSDTAQRGVGKISPAGSDRGSGAENDSPAGTGSDTGQGSPDTPSDSTGSPDTSDAQPGSPATEGPTSTPTTEPASPDPTEPPSSEPTADPSPDDSPAGTSKLPQ